MPTACQPYHTVGLGKTAMEICGRRIRSFLNLGAKSAGWRQKRLWNGFHTGTLHHIIAEYFVINISL